MRIVVNGLIGQYPFGGLIWDYLHYLLGLRALGHDVYYFEDTGAWPYDPIHQTVSGDCSYNVEFLQKLMGEFGFAREWIYRNPADGVFYGAGEEVAREVVKTADLLIHISVLNLLDKHEKSGAHRIFIDSDPMFTQVDIMRRPEDPYIQRLLAHDTHFTFGLNVGEADSFVPTAGITWKKTVQPIFLPEWPFAQMEHNGFFTSVMNWSSYNPCSWQGNEYGQKDIEFLKMIDLPLEAKQRFKLAMGVGVGTKRPTQLLKENGWEIVEPEEAVADHLRYRAFLRQSKAEWSVAKHGYVASKSGWFSGRTACYLALGRPAVVQETGWSQHLPQGEGLLAFSSGRECREAIEKIDADYLRHRASARQMAEQYFDALQVCQDLLNQAGLG